MIVAAHQPHFLPWLGYLAKVAACDLFVVMDDLQYEAQNFQNRNRVKINHGALWLTVPLERGGQRDRICDKRIDNRGGPRHHWQRRAWQVTSWRQITSGFSSSITRTTRSRSYRRSRPPIPLWMW